LSQKATVIVPGTNPDTGLPPGYVWGGAGYVNCSPEGIAAKLAQIENLRTQLHGGVASVGDRGRSVTYRSPGDIVTAINTLQGEVAFCVTGAWPQTGGFRHFYVPQVKGL
jgi:hypothetical protein